MSTSRRIGLMGGTFDPIHLGHLVTAEQARADLDLAEVIFLPAGAPWQKSRDVTSAEHRYLMTVLATAANPAFDVSRMEIDADGPSYTVDTLRRFRAALVERGAVGSRDQLFFITGADAILNILTWKDADECLELATFVAATRPGHDLAGLEREGLRDRVVQLDVPALAISSTDIRQRFAAGGAVRYLVLREVEEYVRKHGLYGTPGGGAGRRVGVSYDDRYWGIDDDEVGDFADLAPDEPGTEVAPHGDGAGEDVAGQDEAPDTDDPPETNEPPESDEPLPPAGPGPGPRQARRAQRRRKRRLTALATVVLGGLVVLGVMSWEPGRNEVPSATGPSPTSAPTTAPTTAPTSAPVAEQDTLLLVRHGPEDNGPALGITLFAGGGGEAVEETVLFLPESTLVDIPGFGVDRLGLSYQYGGAALVEASVENMLGIDVDHVAAVSNSGLAGLLARTGGLDVEVKQQLVERGQSGSAAVRFEPGGQFLDGERLAEYWAFRQRGESELDSFPRQQRVIAALLEAAGDAEVLEALISDGAPQLQTSADTAFLGTLLQRLAAAQQEGELAYTLLPVTPFGAGSGTDDVTYRPVPEDVAKLAEGPLQASVPAGGGAQATRVQVLNGVGTPGIGQDVDRQLEGAGFRIVLTDNARSFDFAETRILVYSEDEASMTAAREVQERLGVGTIQISRQPQSVVDLTIVVGADFVAELNSDEPLTPAEEQTS